jgi:DNA-binding response OmpR family regulator
VLLDITLPKQSGLWVLERLREVENYVPVIVLSARQDEYDKVAALQLGADDYVTKPFALAELLARIVAVLRRSRIGAKSADGRPSPSPKIRTRSPDPESGADRCASERLWWIWTRARYPVRENPCGSRTSNSSF